MVPNARRLKLQTYYPQHGYPLLPEVASRGAELEQEIDERVAGLYGVLETQ